MCVTTSYTNITRRRQCILTMLDNELTWKRMDRSVQRFFCVDLNSLTHFGLVKLCGEINLNIGSGNVTWRHEAITWTDVDFLNPVGFCGILLRVISPLVPKWLFCMINLEMIHGTMNQTHIEITAQSARGQWIKHTLRYLLCVNLN